MRIVEQNDHRLVIVSSPIRTFAIAGGLGVVAVGSGVWSLVAGEGPRIFDSAFGLVVGVVVLVGSLLLYRRTTTVFDRRRRRVTWEQRGRLVHRRDEADFEQIVDVVIGRASSEESGGPKLVSLVLSDRTLPLMFGFSALNPDETVRRAILNVISERG